MNHYSKLFLLVFVVILIGGCATVPPVTVAPTTSLEDVCKRYNIQWQFDSVTQVVLLEFKDHKAKALVGSSVVLIGQQKVGLSGPLRRKNSTIYVPDDFESKVIGSFGAVRSRLGYGVEASSLKIHTIVIDPGHGGKDPGAKGFAGVREKDVVLDIAKKLKLLLQEAGLNVIMTRESDTYPSLEQRTKMATDKDVDFFVSIHANSMPSRKTQGVEVYYVKTQHKRDLDEEQRHKNEKMFTRSLNAAPSNTLSAIVADMMYQLKISESGKMAMRLAHDLSSDLDTPNRGARHCRYFVVRNTLEPAVLIETGFLTNKQEEKRLNSSEYRQRLAESIARSILTYASSS